jgi:hypothetical protein
MKVYFGTSPKIREINPKLVDTVFDLIQKMGHVHTSKWVKGITSTEFAKLTAEELDDHHKKTVLAIKKADVCVFEVSSHSLSVGYLVNLSLENGKVVILLTQSVELPTIFRAIKSDKLITAHYNDKNIEKVLEDALKKAKNVTDVRFNFFVSPKILSYLDWVAQKRMEPRSVFLRDLIEKEMKKDKEFKG